MAYNKKNININNTMSNKPNKYTNFADLSLDDDDEIHGIKIKPTYKAKIMAPANASAKITPTKKYSRNRVSNINTNLQSVQSGPILDLDLTTNNNEEQKKIQEIQESNNINIPDINPSDYIFQNTWNIWVHENDSKDWNYESYKIIHVINNIVDFWEFFNNISKFNQWKYNFFIMKSSSHPTWEHVSNRNGGNCSIRIDITQSIDIIEQLAILLVNESLTEEINDINGVSFAAKGNWSVIKIWNNNNKNNISNQMPSYLRKIYPSISIKYKENIPEY